MPNPELDDPAVPIDQLSVYLLPTHYLSGCTYIVSLHHNPISLAVLVSWETELGRPGLSGSVAHASTSVGLFGIAPTVRLLAAAARARTRLEAA